MKEKDRGGDGDCLLKIQLGLILLCWRRSVLILEQAWWQLIHSRIECQHLRDLLKIVKHRSARN